MEQIAQDPSASPAEEAKREAEAVADIEAGETDETMSFEAAAVRPVVFISHRCVVEPDRSIALKLYEDLSADCDVYTNTAELAGVPFDERIEYSLRTADFVIALITERAAESEWVKYELSYAADRYQRERRPTIIPVRLGFTGQYPPRIGASIGGFNPIEVEPGDYKELFERIKATIDGKPPEIDISVIGIEAFLIREFRRNLIRAACIDSPALRSAGAALQQDKLFWVVGDASIRNHFARSLAVKEHDREPRAGKEQGPRIYEVPRSLNWSKVDDTLVRNAIIIFPDVKLSSLFDEDSPRDELKSLKRLAARNRVIVTSEGPYSEIEQEMRNRDSEDCAHIVVDHNLYDEKARAEIFERLLSFSYESGDITPKQHQWARRLLVEPEEREIFRTIINKWSPTDIERFVTQHLRQVKRQGDILKLLQRNADLDNEIHAWFIALDDSTRCFVLALAMLSGLRKEQLWEKYKLIIQRLRKLDANLSLWPLGICRQRAALYVTTEGQIDFVDERIAEAIYREVTITFREYLIEMVPLVKEITVPPGREQRMTRESFAARKLKAAQDKELRAALARVIGKAGRQGLEDLTELLNFWGADPLLPVREAVALCLEQSVAERVGAKHTLGLLENWCNDTSNSSGALYRTWAAASALGSIVAARPGTDTCQNALYLLERLAGGAHASIRFYVSVSLKKLARKLPLVDGETHVNLATLLSLVARDEKTATKINVAETLIEARIASEAAASGLIREWASGKDADCRWAAVCSVFLWRKQKNEERNRELAGFLAQDAQTTASVLVETLNHKHHKMPALWQYFKQLVLEADDATRRALMSGLATLSQASLEDKLLPLLRASDNTLLSNLVIEVRVERWRRMFSTPPEFLSDLRKETQQRLASDVYSALVHLVKPEPEGCRRELTQALVSCFAEYRTSLDELLTKLTSLNPPIFEPLAIEVRCEGLKRLLSDPLAFISVIAEGLRRADLSGETCVAVELLAQPEPRGNREALLRALTCAQSLNAAAVRSLLRQLRSTASSTLGHLVYEFYLRLLEGELPSPEGFLSRVTEAMQDAGERAEVLQILRQLSVPEPQGRRRALVRTLGAARVTRAQGVDALLQVPSWQSSAGLFSLSTQVKLFSILSSVFSPGIAAKIFAPKH